MNDFFKEIKPYLDILSRYKHQLEYKDDGSSSELRRIYKDYKVGSACNSCSFAPILRGLIGHYEKTPKRGRKRKL